jgi:hypothetical protein
MVFKFHHSVDKTPSILDFRTWDLPSSALSSLGVAIRLYLSITHPRHDDDVFHTDSRLGR